MNDENRKTLEAYEHGLDAYNAAKIPKVTGSLKEWIDTSLQMVPKGSKVLEIGSGHGRDADYIEGQGYSIDRTDAAKSFVNHLKKQGKAARLLNALTDDFGTGYDMVYANAVLLHFTPEQCVSVIHKVSACLKPSGIFTFSVKRGEGAGWSNSKLNAPRYFNYWNEHDLKKLIAQTDFEIVFWQEGSTGHDNSDWYHVTIKKP